MKFGTLGSVDSTGSNQIVYTVTTNNNAVFSVFFKNRATTDGLIRLAVITTAQAGVPTIADWLLYDDLIEAGETSSFTGLTAGSLDTVVINCTAGMSVVVNGREEF